MINQALLIARAAINVGGFERMGSKKVILIIQTSLGAYKSYDNNSRSIKSTICGLVICKGGQNSVQVE